MAQFGYRYFFDVLPLIFLLLIFILPSIPISIQMGLLAYGIFVNFYGTMEFCSLPYLLTLTIGEMLFGLSSVDRFSLCSTIRLEVTY